MRVAFHKPAGIKAAKRAANETGLKAFGKHVANEV
jgi:hypothetical protein